MRSNMLHIETSFSRALAVTGGPHVHLLSRCESVIEQAFAAGFIVNQGFKVKPTGAHWVIERGEDKATLTAQHEVTQAADPWANGADPEVAFARADFALSVADRVVLLVDVDGHDFHERSKEQIQRDRSRDRRLLRCRLPVVRFTGSEVNRSARNCAAEAFQLALELSK